MANATAEQLGLLPPALVQRLVPHFEQLALVRVHPGHLCRRNGEEGAVKELSLDVATVLDALELAVAQGLHVHLVVEKPSLCWHSAHRITAIP